MDYYIIICALLVTIVLVLSIFTMVKSKRQVNEFKYKMFNWITVILSVLVILLLTSSIESLLSYFKSQKVMLLLNAYIFLVVAILFSFRAFSNHYICDTGIWYTGHLYKWGEIESNKWSDDERHVSFIMKKKFLGIESELKFAIKEHSREEIKNYLSNHMEKIG